MIVTELKSVCLTVNEYKGIASTVPTSAITALLDEGLLDDPYYANNIEEVRGIYPIHASFGMEFTVDTMLLSHKYIYLEVGGFDHPLTLFVNGNPIAALDNVDITYLVDIRAVARFGKNTVELRFGERFADPDDYLTDISLISPVRVIATNFAMIDNVVVGATYKDGAATVDIDLTLVGDESSVRAVATLVSPSGSVSYSGFTGGHGSITLALPSSWWPGDLGPHSLYRLTVNLYHDSEVVDTYESTVGFRDFAISTVDGKRQLTLAGKRFFPLGAVHIKEDHLKPRITGEKIERLLGLVTDAGINTLYLKGYNSLPPHSLLYAADRLGISVWIHLPALKEARSEAEERVIMRDARRVLRRLSVHPSLTLVIGDERMRGIAGELLPSVIFTTSLVEVAPFGIPSLPSLETCQSFCPSEELNFLSPIIEKRCTSHLINMLGDILEGYRMPDSFDEFIYLTELLSARHAEKIAIRERMKEGSFGSVIDRLSDSVPKPSSSAVDYYLRPKALWYHAKRFYRPTIVKAEVDGTRVKFLVSNLVDKAMSLALVYSVCNSDGGEVFRDTVKVSVGAREVATVYECDLASIVSGKESELCLAYSIQDGISTFSSGTHFFLPPRYFNFKKPNITVDISGTGREYILSVSTDKLAAAVALDFGDEDVILDDNYFDLTSATTRQIKLYTPSASAVEALRRKLTVRSLYDVGRFD